MLWNGGCRKGVTLAVWLENKNSSSIEECRKLCQETKECGVFLNQNGTDSCNLFREEAISTCEIDDPPLETFYTAYSVYTCGVGMQIDEQKIQFLIQYRSYFINIKFFSPLYTS